MTRSLPLAAAFLGCSLAVPTRAAGPLAPEPGTWWEITSAISVSGKNVPPEVQQKQHTSTSRECLPKKIPDRPPPDTGDCAISDYRHSGARVSFKMACQGGVTGETDLSWTSDTYSGKAVMRGQGIESRIALTGKKVGGDCDANQKARERASAREALRESSAHAADADQADEPQEPQEPVEQEAGKDR